MKSDSLNEILAKIMNATDMGDAHELARQAYELLPEQSGEISVLGVIGAAFNDCPPPDDPGVADAWHYFTKGYEAATKRESSALPFNEKVLIRKALDLYGSIDTEQMCRTVKAMRAMNMSASEIEGGAS